MKAKFKELHAAKKTEMLQGVGRNGTPILEYRMRYVEELIQESITTITPNKCLQCINRVQRHYPGVLALDDLPVGL